MDLFLLGVYIIRICLFNDKYIKWTKCSSWKYNFF